MKRISVGGALSRLALAAFLEGAREMKETGGFTWMRDTVPSKELKAVFGRWPQNSHADRTGHPATPLISPRVSTAPTRPPARRGHVGGIRAAFDEHSVLLFRGAGLDDETQVAFSLRFGALEVTRSMNPAAGTPFARQSNLDIKTGQVIPADDRRMIYQLAKTLWHSDSSFKPVPSLCSPLTGRIVPP